MQKAQICQQLGALNHQVLPMAYGQTVLGSSKQICNPFVLNKTTLTALSYSSLIGLHVFNPRKFVSEHILVITLQTTLIIYFHDTHNCTANSITANDVLQMCQQSGLRISAQIMNTSRIIWCKNMRLVGCINVQSGLERNQLQLGFFITFHIHRVAVVFGLKRVKRE